MRDENHAPTRAPHTPHTTPHATPQTSHHTLHTNPPPQPMLPKPLVRSVRSIARQSPSSVHQRGSPSVAICQRHSSFAARCGTVQWRHSAGRNVSRYGRGRAAPCHIHPTRCMSTYTLPAALPLAPHPLQQHILSTLCRWVSSAAFVTTTTQRSTRRRGSTASRHGALN